MPVQPSYMTRRQPSLTSQPKPEVTLQLHNLHPVCAWPLCLSPCVDSPPLPSSGIFTPFLTARNLYLMNSTLSGEHHSTLRPSCHQQETPVPWSLNVKTRNLFGHTFETALLVAENPCGSLTILVSSIAQRVFGRRTKTVLPSTHNQLKPGGPADVGKQSGCR